MFGGPYDEEYMTYWSNGGYGGGYGGYHPGMIWQNGYSRGYYDRDIMYAYLYGRGRHCHHRSRPSIRFSPQFNNWGNGWMNNGQVQGLNPWAHLGAGPRRLEGADMMGLAAFGMEMGAPMIQCMGW
ncbi:hypothetical protein CKM354_000008600 [Cercospora kikuchii]|uniref:Uncharacterized protein n=1 Tax=Cercospora kikuchii TaxID=84275 RepID=A0A9P3F6W9_9PEZI|nr:uncharacterized protein CKM354_000008600 [Cercospora kikuchii]GIZ36616.1 hypothetical protein CKM354_000008600 [Cercospora kikuchii]